MPPGANTTFSSFGTTEGGSFSRTPRAIVDPREEARRKAGVDTQPQTPRMSRSSTPVRSSRSISRGTTPTRERSSSRGATDRSAPLVLPPAEVGSPQRIAKPVSNEFLDRLTSPTTASNTRTALSHFARERLSIAEKHGPFRFPQAPIDNFGVVSVPPTSAKFASPHGSVHVAPAPASAAAAGTPTSSMRRGESPAPARGRGTSATRSSAQTARATTPTRTLSSEFEGAAAGRRGRDSSRAAPAAAETPVNVRRAVKPAAAAAEAEADAEAVPEAANAAGEVADPEAVAVEATEAAPAEDASTEAKSPEPEAAAAGTEKAAAAEPAAAAATEGEAPAAAASAEAAPAATEATEEKSAEPAAPTEEAAKSAEESKAAEPAAAAAAAAGTAPTASPIESPMASSRTFTYLGMFSKLSQRPFRVTVADASTHKDYITAQSEFRASQPRASPGNDPFCVFLCGFDKDATELFATTSSTLSLQPSAAAALGIPEAADFAPLEVAVDSAYGSFEPRPVFYDGVEGPLQAAILNGNTTTVVVACAPGPVRDTFVAGNLADVKKFGLIPISAIYLFSIAEKDALHTYDISSSLYEVHEGKVYDLLRNPKAADARVPLPTVPKADGSNELVIEGLTTKAAKIARDLPMHLLLRRAHPLGQSTTVFELNLTRTPKEGVDPSSIPDAMATRPASPGSAPGSPRWLSGPLAALAAGPVSCKLRFVITPTSQSLAAESDEKQSAQNAANAAWKAFEKMMAATLYAKSPAGVKSPIKAGSLPESTIAGILADGLGADVKSNCIFIAVMPQKAENFVDSVDLIKTSGALKGLAFDAHGLSIVPEGLPSGYFRPMVPTAEQLGLEVEEAAAVEEASVVAEEPATAAVEAAVEAAAAVV